MKVILAEFAVPFWLKVAADLQQRYDITPVAWTALKNMQGEMQTLFPNCQFLDLADVKRNVFPPPVQALQHGPFDRHCQTVWIEMAQLIFDQYHRWDRSGDFTTLERTEHFYEALVFWNALIERDQPDAILFRNAPHAVYDLMLLGLARSRGIRTFMFHHTSVPPYSIASADLDRGSQPFHEGLRLAQWEIQAGRQPDERELHPHVLEAIQKMRLSYDDAMPWYQASSVAGLKQGWTFQRIKKTASHVLHSFKKELKRWCRGRVDHSVSSINNGSLTKERGRHLRDSYFGAFQLTRYAIDRIFERRRVIALRACYQKFAKWNESDPPRSFVYVAFSFQPEATSNPHAGIYAQQLLMVNALATALPEGWTLVVREHPAQFNWEFIGQVSRNEEYYRLLSVMPRVRLAPLNLDPFHLMDSCVAVATLVGTSGWEALVRGKPALIFGDIWYDRCAGVFRVRNQEDCRKAFQQIAAGVSLRPEIVADFVKELDFSAIQAGHELEVAPPGVETTTDQLRGISDLVAQVLGLPPADLPRVNLRALVLDN